MSSTSSSATVNISELLAPIAGDNPAGESLLYTVTYDAIREARSADDPNLAQGDWKRELKVASWREVRKLASEALTTKSKDLQLAAWLTESLVKQHGFTGARDGFRLLRGLLDQFWQSLYPLPEDNDLEFRAQILDSLNNSLPAALGELKLTSGGPDKDYSLNEWRESRQVEEKGLKSPQEREALIKEGKITGEQWDKAVTGTRRAFCEALLEEVTDSLQECDKLAAIVDQKFGREAPSLLDLRRTLEECHSLVESIVKKKRELEPDAAAAETKSLEAGSDASAAEATVNGVARSDEIVTITTSKNSTRKTTASPSITISVDPLDRADALQRLGAIAEFFHRSEPHSPVAYLVQRAVRWGQMPLEQWLNDVISDQSVLTHIRETLGIRKSEENGG